MSSLDDFDCVKLSENYVTKSLVCYRPVAASVISDYKTNYQYKYASKAAEYLKQSAECPGSNGDASRVVATTFPFTLWPVGKHEFGFNVQYGSTRPGDTLVSHGFASTSPAIQEQDISAIEYFAVEAGSYTRAAKRTSVGNWELDIDTSGVEPLRPLLRRMGLSGRGAQFSIGLVRGPLAPPAANRATLLATLASRVASALENEGFVEFSDSRIERATGKSRDELTKMFEESRAFGIKDVPGPGLPDFRLFMKQDGASCTASNRGAYGAYVFYSKGPTDVQDDFGNISLFVLGAGACGSYHAEAYAKNLVGEVKDTLLRELAR